MDSQIPTTPAMAPSATHHAAYTPDINDWKWKILNFTQVAFFFFWSFLWQTVAITARLVMWNVDRSLWMAHKIWAPPLLRITGSEVTPHHREKIDFSQPHIFVSSHQSSLDIAVAFEVLPVPLRFVAKKELHYVPFLGWYMWAMGMIFVDRRRSQKAIASLKRAGELIREGANIIAFPEGTRSPDGRILPLKKGIFVLAIEAGVPIIPMAIEGTRHVMPKNTFQLRPHEIKVRFGDPIPTKDLTYEDREALRKEVQAQLIELNLALGGLGPSDEAVAEA